MDARAASLPAGRDRDGGRCRACWTVRPRRDRRAPAASPGKTREPRLPIMGIAGAIPVDEKMANSDSNGSHDGEGLGTGKNWHLYLSVLLVAGAIYLGCIVSPPSLMDDVDAVQAQIARNMLDSGDWVIAHLDGVPYLEKSPVIYWLIAISFRIFGVHDWAARIPVALAAVLLAWVTYRYGRWAFEERAGHYAGLVVATCVGLFLFTRIQIPDVMLTLTVCLAFWAFQRATDPEEAHPKLWAAVLAASLGVGMMLKGLIALVIPGGGILLYLVLTRQ